MGKGRGKGARLLVRTSGRGRGRGWCGIRSFMRFMMRLFHGGEGGGGMGFEVPAQRGKRGWVRDTDGWVCGWEV